MAIHENFSEGESQMHNNGLYYYYYSQLNADRFAAAAVFEGSNEISVPDVQSPVLSVSLAYITLPLLPVLRGEGNKP